jgi:hypothetical protein
MNPDLAEAHGICGEASYALTMTPSGSGQKGELTSQATEELERSLHVEPQNKHLRQMLEHVKQNPAAPKEQKSGCLIATAACGDPLAPEVIALSVFRDEVLQQGRPGRAFVRCYYAVSPSVAAVIAQSGALRRE